MNATQVSALFPFGLMLAVLLFWQVVGGLGDRGQLRSVHGTHASGSVERSMKRTHAKIQDSPSCDQHVTNVAKGFALPRRNLLEQYSASLHFPVIFDT